MDGRRGSKGREEEKEGRGKNEVERKGVKERQKRMEGDEKERKTRALTGSGK